MHCIVVTFHHGLDMQGQAMIKGIDTPLNATQYLSAISQAKLEFVGRYYRHKGSKWPSLNEAEVKAIQAAKIKVVALWEYASNSAGYFSHTSGVDDGTSAYRQALLAGQPPGAPIYFAVDYDASQAQVAGSVNDYFRGVADGFAAIGSGAPAYKIGVYGSGRTCGWLLTHGRAAYTWLAVSTGWAGYDFASWNIKQGKPTALAFNNDADDAKPDYGGF